MANTFDDQLSMILSLPGSMITQNCGLSFKDALEPLTVAIYTFPHLLLFRVSIGIEKAFFHRIVFLYAISTCSSPMSLQDGKVPQQMLRSGLMHWPEVFQCQQDSIILQMQDFLIARNFLFLFVVFITIFRSGVLLVLEGPVLRLQKNWDQTGPDRFRTANSQDRKRPRPRSSLRSFAIVEIKGLIKNRL